MLNELIKIPIMAQRDIGEKLELFPEYTYEYLKCYAIVLYYMTVR